jgi:hypothetical protein
MYRLRRSLLRRRIDPATCHHDRPRRTMTTRRSVPCRTSPINRPRVAKVRSSRGAKDQAATPAYRRSTAKISSLVIGAAKTSAYPRLRTLLG